MWLRLFLTLQKHAIEEEQESKNAFIYLSMDPFNWTLKNKNDSVKNFIVEEEIELV